MLVGHTLSDAKGRLLAVDGAVCEIMQRNAGELAGLSYVALTHPDDRARSNDYVSRLGLFDGPMKIRKRYVRPDGSAVWAAVRASRVITDNAVRLIGTIRLYHPDRTVPDPGSLWRSARRALATIQRRRLDLGDDLFSDHAWIILLQIYLAEAEGRLIDAITLAESADLRIDLVERWIRALEQKTLIDRFGGQRFGLGIAQDIAVQLTTAGVAMIERLLDADGEE